jgi:hypothetical protein
LSPLRLPSFTTPACPCEYKKKTCIVKGKLALRRPGMTHAAS